MAYTSPFEQLVGTLKCYLAPAGEAEPVVNVTPAGNWIEFGPTDGNQEIHHEGALTLFSDNDHQGNVKAVRPSAGIMISFTVVGLTLENYARVLSNVNQVTADAGPPAIKKMPLRRPVFPEEYALLMKGEADSPYGNYPAQYYIPKVVMGGEPVVTRAKDGRPGLEVEIVVLEDDTQSSGDEMGWVSAQTS